MAMVHKAAALANIASFIEDELINKYDTIFGQRGISILSSQ
jgi:hypothetical protein